MPLVYEELRRLAAVHLAREPGRGTLQPTALVHEAYLRLGGEAHWDNRGHFLAAAAEAIRRILIDNARRKRAEKHGGRLERVPLDNLAAAAPDGEVLALNEALDKLATNDPLKAQLVELRYFAGLTGDQAAEVLGISASTADRHWTYARAWLQAELRGR